jgi:hypothetical protein
MSRPATYDASGQRETILSRARRFFADNPGEILYREDLRLKFDCSAEMAKLVARTLIQEGAVERWQLPRPPRQSQAKEDRQEPPKPFPECLTRSERSAIEAYIAAGSIVKAAWATGRNYNTLGDQLKDARRKAEAHTTAELAMRFLKAAA